MQWLFAIALAIQSWDATLARGLEALEAGRMGEAEQAFREAIDIAPDEVRAKMLLTNLFLDTERPERALEIIEPLIQGVPEADRSPTANTVYGLALAQSGRHADAVAPLRAALAVQPRRAKALFNLGRSLQALERFDEAAEVYRKGLAFLPPENIRFALGLARCQVRLSQLDEARAHLDDLVAKHPEVGRAWLLRGIVAFEEERYRESEDDVLKALENGYQLAESDLRLGMALGRLGEYEEAQRALDRALEKEPDLATAHYFKGLFLFQEGETLAPGSANPFGLHAVRLLERSLELAPNPKTSLALAEVELRLRLHTQVVESARAGATVPELAPRAYHLMALAHHELLEYEPAEAAYERAAEAGANSAELYHDWGNLLSVMGRWDEAKAVLHKVLERNPDFVGSLLQLGVVHLNLREHETALDYLGRVIAMAPDNAEAWYQKGVVESRQNDPAAAAASWQRALELDPEQTRLYYRLGAELVKLGRVDERNALLEEFAERERRSELAAQRSEQLLNLLNGAVAASEAEDDDRALALLNAAKNLAPDDPLPYVYLGDFYLSRDRLGDAKRVLEEGLVRMSNELSLYQTMLSVHTARGDAAAADEARSRIRKIIKGAE